MAKLTVKALAALCKNGKTGLTADGRGLYFKIGAGGGACWVYRYMHEGKSRYMGLGSYPEIGLPLARDKAEDARRQLKSGIDPLAAREAERDQQRREKEEAALAKLRSTSFEAVALDYIESHRSGWKNEKHGQQWLNTLTTYALPVIGNLSTDEVTTEHVLAVLMPIWTTKPETASRVRNRVELVLDAAKARGLREGENPARWRGHLDKLLPKPTKVKAVEHHPALPWQDLPKFVRQLRTQPGLGAQALLLTILTACRTGEVIYAEWSEIKGDVWTIPASRMKAGKEHRVPLSKEAQELISSLPREPGNPFLFPGMRPGKAISNGTMLALLKRMKQSHITPHGFRSTFRDWSAEATHYPREVCEQALAHSLGTDVEAAYRRGDLFEKRRALMQDWADYATQTNTQPNVVSIDKSRAS